MGRTKRRGCHIAIDDLPTAIAAVDGSSSGGNSGCRFDPILISERHQCPCCRAAAPWSRCFRRCGFRQLSMFEQPPTVANRPVRVWRERHATIVGVCCAAPLKLLKCKALPRSCCNMDGVSDASQTKAYEISTPVPTPAANTDAMNMAVMARGLGPAGPCRCCCPWIGCTRA